MRQNPRNHFRLFDAGDHLELPAAARAGVDLDGSLVGAAGEGGAGESRSTATDPVARWASWPLNHAMPAKAETITTTNSIVRMFMFGPH
jgi:hypothetical protein